MPDVKPTGLTELLAPSMSDVVYVGDGVASDKYMSIGRLLGMVGVIPGGRISGTTTAFQIGDQTGIDTIYYVPYKHNLVQLYDSTNGVWITYPFSTLSIAVPATTNTNYDVFVELSGGVPALSLIAWSNDSTRATDVVYQSGRLVASGNPEKLLVGTFRTGGVSGETGDWKQYRFISNVYNREFKRILLADNTSHNYTTSAWRPWNNDYSYVCAVVSSIYSGVISHFTGESYNTGSADDLFYGQGICIDATTSATHWAHQQTYPVHRDTSGIFNYLSPGYHFLQAVEYGNNGVLLRNSVMSGRLEC